MSRFLHLIDDLEYGGAQRQLQLLATAAEARGDKIVVGSLCRPSVVGEELRAAGIAVRWLGRRFRIDPLVVGRLARAFSRGALDGVQSWDAVSGRHVLAAIRLTRSRPRWLHTVRSIGEPSLVEKRVRLAADGVIVPGKTLLDTLIEQGVSEKKLHVVPNGVAGFASDADSRTDARQRVRQELAIADDAAVVVAVCRFDEAARAKELAWAIDLIRAVRPGIRLLMVGEGVARRRVERFAREATEPGTVRFLGHRMDLPDVIAAADVVWCTSASPDMPTPLLEAMAAGKPIVANAALGRDETVALTAWDDRAGWARATDRLLDVPTQTLVSQKHDMQAALAAHDAAWQSTATLT